MTDSRIYYDKSLGRNADETLETVYFQVYHQTSSETDKQAFGSLLDQYAERMLTNHIPFGNSAFEYTLALQWARQFGVLYGPWDIGRPEFIAHTELRKDGCLFGAKIERNIPWACCVYAKTRHDAVILAGVQVLRELSYQVLNPSFAGTCTN